jgi:hypothetical protein
LPGRQPSRRTIPDARSAWGGPGAPTGSGSRNRRTRGAVRELLARPFANVRRFGTAQRQKAWPWLTEGLRDERDKDRVRRLASSKWQPACCPPGDGLSFWVEAEHDLHAHADAHPAAGV